MQRKKHWKTRRKCHHQVKVPLVTFQKMRHKIWSSDMRRDKFLYFRPKNIVHYIVGMIHWFKFWYLLSYLTFYKKFLNYLPIVLQKAQHWRLLNVKLNLDIVFVILFIICLCNWYIYFIFKFFSSILGTSLMLLFETEWTSIFHFRDSYQSFQMKAMP